MSMTDERVELLRRASGNRRIQEEEEQVQGEQPEGSDSGSGKKKRRSTGARITLWILRRSIVPLIMVIMLVAGLYIGYTVLGKQPGSEVFQWATWQHLYDLIFADT